MGSEMSEPAMRLTAEDTTGKKPSWDALERQDWHLWILAVLLMFVLGVSLLSFMFPSACWFQEQLTMKAPQRAFIGFCVLLALVLVYMLQRQATVRRLKRQLFEARAAVVETERQAATQAFLALPGMDQFRDAMAMEYRRAAISSAHLAVVLLAVGDASREELGCVTNLLRCMRRRGETLFRVSDNTLGLVLPGMPLSDANMFVTHVIDQVRGQFPEAGVTPTVTTYPEEASLSELEGRLSGHIQ